MSSSLRLYGSVSAMCLAASTEEAEKLLPRIISPTAAVYELTPMLLPTVGWMGMDVANGDDETVSYVVEPLRTTSQLNDPDHVYSFGGGKSVRGDFKSIEAVKSAFEDYRGICDRANSQWLRIKELELLQSPAKAFEQITEYCGFRGHINVISLFNYIDDLRSKAQGGEAFDTDAAPASAIDQALSELTKENKDALEKSARYERLYNDQAIQFEKQFRALTAANDKIAALEAEKAREITIGDLTMKLVFSPPGIKNLSDMQLVMNAVEASLVNLTGATNSLSLIAEKAQKENLKLGGDLVSKTSRIAELEGQIARMDGEHLDLEQRLKWQAETKALKSTEKTIPDPMIIDQVQPLAKPDPSPVSQASPATAAVPPAAAVAPSSIAPPPVATTGRNIDRAIDILKEEWPMGTPAPLIRDRIRAECPEPLPNWVHDKKLMGIKASYLGVKRSAPVQPIQPPSPVIASPDQPSANLSPLAQKHLKAVRDMADQGLSPDDIAAELNHGLSANDRLNANMVRKILAEADRIAKGAS